MEMKERSRRNETAMKRNETVEQHGTQNTAPKQPSRNNNVAVACL